MSHSVDFHLRVQRLINGSLVARLTGPSNVSTAALLTSSMTSKTSSQSSIGALYYVIAVVLIYGFSIILMIGSQIRKNKHDKGVSRLSALPRTGLHQLAIRNWANQNLFAIYRIKIMLDSANYKRLGKQFQNKFWPLNNKSNTVKFEE